MTLALTNIELYFLKDTLKRSWIKVFKRNVSVIPYFLVNSVFKIMSVSFIFATFKHWGLIIHLLWAIIYMCMIPCLHGRNVKPVAGMLSVVKNFKMSNVGPLFSLT